MGAIADRNKAEILRMAAAGEKMPGIDCKLGRALQSYKFKGNHSYDEEFRNELRKINPSYVMGVSETSSEKKKKLIEMATNNEERPKGNSTLGGCFNAYTCTKSPIYDEEFKEKIKSLGTNWFVGRSRRSNIKKQKLIEIATNGEERPKEGSVLSNALKNYMNKIGPSYDEKFCKIIKSLRKDWFANNLTKLCNIKKKKLIEMAKNNKERPKNDSVLGNALYRYVSRKSESYDEEFSATIGKLQPSWLFNASDICKEKKQQLIFMAANGDKKPKTKSVLGMALDRYTNKNSGSYDEEFSAKIIRLRKDWVKS